MSRAERPADELFYHEGEVRGNTRVRRTPRYARGLSDLPLQRRRIYIELGPEPDGTVRQRPQPPAQPPIADIIPKEVRKALRELKRRGGKRRRRERQEQGQKKGEGPKREGTGKKRPEQDRAPRPEHEQKKKKKERSRK